MQSRKPAPTLQTQLTALAKAVSEIKRDITPFISNNGNFQQRPMTQQFALPQPAPESMSAMMAFMDAVNRRLDEMQKTFEALQASIIRDQTEYKSHVEAEIASLKTLLRNELGIYPTSSTSESVSEAAIVANGLVDRVNRIGKRLDEVQTISNTSVRKIENHKTLLKHLQTALEVLPESIDTRIETQLQRSSKSHLLEIMAQVDVKLVASEQRVQKSVQDTIDFKVKNSLPFMQTEKKIAAIASDIQLLAECCEQNKARVTASTQTAAELKKRLESLNEGMQLLIGNNLFKCSLHD